MKRVIESCPLGAECQTEDSETIHRCKWYKHIRGTNPNTGEEVDQYDCAIGWFPMLLIENSQQQRQTGAAVESFRNEMVNANQESRKALVHEILNNQLTGKG